MAKTPNLATPTVPIDLIDRPANIRREPGDTAELEGSIANIGLIEPLVVRSDGNGRFVLLAGFRRIAALERLGMTEAPVHVITHPKDDLETSRIVLQLVENLQRVDISPIEEASGYAQLKQYGWKQAEIAKRVARSEGHVSKRLSLLNLPDEAITLHEKGRIGSESLYELTKVVTAGGDLSPIIEQLSSSDVDDIGSARAVEEVERLVDHVVETAKVEKKMAERRAELEAAGVTVLEATYDEHRHQPTLPKDQLSWRFDIDVDKHSKEPCHAVCVYRQWGSMRESYHCTDRRRHQPDGASKLKAVDNSAAGTSAREESKRKKREAEARARTKALTEAAESVLAGRAPARDKILERMATLYLDAVWAEVLKRAIRWLDLEAELDNYIDIKDLYRDANTADQYRILLAVVLAHGHNSSTGSYVAEDSLGPQAHLEFLLECGQDPFAPKDPEEA